MNQPVNPYESPQAELSASPFTDGVILTTPGLRTTGVGLSLVYYGIVLLLLALLVIFIGYIFISFMVARPGAPAGDTFPHLTLLTIAAIVVIIGGLLMFAGQIVCLFVPAESGAKGFIIAAVSFQILYVLDFTLPIVERLNPNTTLPYPLRIAINLGGIIGSLCFVLFLRKLSDYIGRIDLKNRARNVLILGSILFCLAVIRFGIRLSQPNGLLIVLIGGVSIVLLIGFLIGFIMYANLINALRKVLLGKATGSSENEDPNSGRLIASGKRLA